MANRIEVLLASIKQRSQHLSRDHDGCKSHARIRRKIKEEVDILKPVVEAYNTMVPDEEKIAFDSMFSEETVWPWQPPPCGMYTNLTVDTLMSHMVAQNQVRLIPDLRSYLNDNLEYDCIPDVVDMKTKRRAFDLTMSIKRLEEERKIVATEMQKHWKNLSTQKDTLKQLSFLLSTDSSRGMYI